MRFVPVSTVHANLVSRLCIKQCCLELRLRHSKLFSMNAVYCFLAAVSCFSAVPIVYLSAGRRQDSD